MNDFSREDLKTLFDLGGLTAKVEQCREEVKELWETRSAKEMCKETRKTVNKIMWILVLLFSSGGAVGYFSQTKIAVLEERISNMASTIQEANSLATEIKDLLTE